MSSSSKIMKQENIEALFHKISYMTFYEIYKVQDEILTRIMNSEDSFFPQIILAGGTALARYYLNHRISRDLDFFLPGNFDPAIVEKQFSNLGIPLSDVTRISGGRFVTQLHGWSQINGQRIKVSVIEDLFADMFDVTVINNVRTEVIDGLYHRKLRTITGTGFTVSTVGQEQLHGGRQHARDIFDLYVLDSQQESINQFVERINHQGANFPVDGFIRGISRMPWIELIDEFELLETLPHFHKITAYDAKRYFDVILSALSTP